MSFSPHDGGGAPVQLLSNVALIRHSVDPSVIDHYTVQRVIDVDSAVSGRDLGSTTAAVQQAIASLGRPARHQNRGARPESGDA